MGRTAGRFPVGFRLLVWKISWAFGLSVVGWPWSGADALLGSRIATPRLVVSVRFDAPWVRPVGLVPAWSFPVGAWWLENWIVDASNWRSHCGFFLLLSISIRTRRSLWFLCSFDRLV
ncbi:hypothetical protein CUU80_07050 [Bifidobacterium scaligerum]|uniref:Uncharacterized protein n=1 Tax=Bifidobacterium scaligerum TaxID=2052656 RepID=A0A2M9HPH6_9BIFI|nr:hypothetical protein CUU80_07050 [Bifidobacterium scaligerum]